MSGQLVGEVIAASAALQKRGVSLRGFFALIAIAEKCHTHTRRGSVRWNHIRDGLYGASHRTAQRAVHDLLTAGVIDLVKPGFGNQYGRTCAPVYWIAPLVDDDTWVTRSNEVDNDTHVSQSNEVDDDKSKVDNDKSGSGSRHLGVVLDGPIDGPIDGGSSPQPGTALDEPQPSTNTPPLNRFAEQERNDPEPPQFCARHPQGTTDNCGPCGTARHTHDAWKRRRLDSLNELKSGIRQEIDACNECTDYGQNGGEHCQNHPNFKQDDIRPLMKEREQLIGEVDA